MSNFASPLDEPTTERSHLEPELGGVWRDAPDRSGLEPELGGVLRQKVSTLMKSPVLGASTAPMLLVTPSILSQITVAPVSSVRMAIQKKSFKKRLILAQSIAFTG
jgi:hypothetical protein